MILAKTEASIMAPEQMTATRFATRVVSVCVVDPDGLRDLVLAQSYDAGRAALDDRTRLRIGNPAATKW
jgi:hypothetical protein